MYRGFTYNKRIESNEPGTMSGKTGQRLKCDDGGIGVTNLFTGVS